MKKSEKKIKRLIIAGAIKRNRVLLLEVIAMNHALLQRIKKIQ